MNIYKKCNIIDFSIIFINDNLKNLKNLENQLLISKFYSNFAHFSINNKTNDNIERSIHV